MKSEAPTSPLKNWLVIIKERGVETFRRSYVRAQTGLATINQVCANPKPWQQVIARQM